MKILIQHEDMASHYIYDGLANAFKVYGHEVMFWTDLKQCPAFDMFDYVFKPDIFIGQGYKLTRAHLKVLAQNPNVKVYLKVGIWGPACDKIDTNKYPVLMASEEEKEMVKKLSRTNYVAVFNYCSENYEEFLMDGWSKLGVDVQGMLPAADTTVFTPGLANPNLECDIGFVGGYWPYKAQNFNKYILPLCHPVGKYKIKIFGNQIWPVSQYCGPCSNETQIDLFRSAKVCPNVSEPHANVFKYEVNERVFKLAACKTAIVTDMMEDVFDNNIPIAKDPEDFTKIIKHLISNEKDREAIAEAGYNLVMSKHTYYHRADDIMKLMGFGGLSKCAS